MGQAKRLLEGFPATWPTPRTPAPRASPTPGPSWFRQALRMGLAAWRRFPAPPPSSPPWWPRACPPARFAFEGFLPQGRSERKERLCASPLTMTAGALRGPHRLRQHPARPLGRVLRPRTPHGCRPRTLQETRGGLSGQLCEQPWSASRSPGVSLFWSWDPRRSLPSGNRPRPRASR